MTKTNYEKISILIPSFNAQKTLKKTLNSALIQKYPNFDILISDNNSDDKSKFILQKIKKKNIKIYYQKKNIGAPRNWMFLTKKTKAKIIIFLGADDKFKNKYSIKNLYLNMKKTNTVCTAGGYIQVYKKLRNKIFLKKSDTNLSFLIKSISGKYNFLWYAMWDKKSFQRLLKKFQTFQGLPELSLDRISMFFILIDYNLNFSTFDKICYVKKMKNKKIKKVRSKIALIFLEFFISFKLIIKEERKNFVIKFLFICLMFIFNFYRLSYSLLRKFI